MQNRRFVPPTERSSALVPAASAASFFTKEENEIDIKVTQLLYNINVYMVQANEQKIAKDLFITLLNESKTVGDFANKLKMRDDALSRIITRTKSSFVEIKLKKNEHQIIAMIEQCSDRYDLEKALGNISIIAVDYYLHKRNTSIFELLTGNRPVAHFFTIIRDHSQDVCTLSKKCNTSPNKLYDFIQLCFDTTLERTIRVITGMDEERFKKLCDRYSCKFKELNEQQKQELIEVFSLQPAVQHEAVEVTMTPESRGNAKRGMDRPPVVYDESDIDEAVEMLVDLGKPKTRMPATPFTTALKHTSSLHRQPKRRAVENSPRRKHSYGPGSD